MKDHDWLLEELAEIFEQSDEHREAAKQPKQIAANKNGTHTWQIKEDKVKILEDRRRSV